MPTAASVRPERLLFLCCAVKIAPVVVLVHCTIGYVIANSKEILTYRDLPLGLCQQCTPLSTIVRNRKCLARPVCRRGHMARQQQYAVSAIMADSAALSRPH